MRKDRPQRPSQQVRPEKDVESTHRDKGLTKGTLVTITIRSFSDDGFGKAELAGRSILVAGTVPGDRLSARIVHIGTHVLIATLVTMIEASKQRAIRQRCPDAAVCLGCPLIVLEADAQRVMKQSFVKDAFSVHQELRGTSIAPLLEPALSLHYRTTAKLAVAGTYREPYIGMYRRTTHDVVDLEGCPVHHPLINRVIQAVRSGICDQKIQVWQEKKRSGILRYLVVRVSESSRQAMVTFVTARRAFNEMHHLAAHVKSLVPEVTVICQNVNSSEGNVIFGSQDHFISKEHSMVEQIGTVRLEVSPRSFLQAQNDGARLLYETVRDKAAITSESRVLDVYCGIGGIALTLAPRVQEVYGVELNQEAVKDARKNARLNNARNCRFEAGDAAEMLEGLVEDGEHFDLVVVNPPRKGCERAVIEQLLALAAPTIAYVSCSPQTLARDLAVLVAGGYHIELVQPVDMFPQTMHVETVVILRLTPKK